MSKQETMTIFNELLSKDKDSKWRDEVDFRQANKAWLKKSAKIAIKINRALRDQKMSQKDLAVKLGVSAQQVNKILKGRENLKLETISKLENALKIELMKIINQHEIDEIVNAAILDYHRKWTRTKEYERVSGIKGESGAILCIEDDNDYALAG